MVPFFREVADLSLQKKRGQAFEIFCSKGGEIREAGKKGIGGP